MELFHNHSLYKQYHEKILKSYIIDNAPESNENLSLDEFFTLIGDSEFKNNEISGLGQSFKFSNSYGNGSVIFFDDELIHVDYFKNPDDIE